MLYVHANLHKTAQSDQGLCPYSGDEIPLDSIAELQSIIERHEKTVFAYMVKTKAQLSCVVTAQLISAFVSPT